MKDGNVEQIRERLDYYTYQASYEEYNIQEVNYLIDFLKEHDHINEDRIQKSVIHILFNKNCSKKDTSKRISNIKIVSMILAASLLFLILSNNTIAYIKMSGVFHILYSDKTKQIILVNPESDIVTYTTFDDIPEPQKNIILQFDLLPNGYILEKIEFNQITKDIIVRYTNVQNENGYLNMIYANSLNTEEYGKIYKTSFYDHTLVTYYINKSTFRCAFNIDQIYYCIESDSIDAISFILNNYIVF